MASSVITETLRSVTSTKIRELKKQREQYEISKGKILRDAKAAASDLKCTNLLLREVCREAGIRFVDEGLLGPDTQASATATCKRRDQQLFLCQAEKDPALAPSLIQDIEQEVLEHFELKSVRHEHAELFSELATEWLSCSEESKSSPVTTGTMDDSSFETIGRKEMHEQRAQWESVVFSKSNVDVSHIKNYLQKLFNSNKVVSNAFRTVQNATRSEALSMWRDTVLFDVDNLKTTIQSLLKSDLLSEEKAAIVKSFKSNDEVLQEVADVLTMRMASLETWQWSTVNGAITVSQRRQLNGKYRVFMDEDILDALLLHAIGMKWAVHFRHQFLTFFHSPAWMTPGTRVPKHDQDRRTYYLGQDSVSHGTAETIRRSQYERDYFMTQLPDSEPDGVRGYGDEDDQATSPSRKSPLETKQSLLHLLITEALTARHLRPTVPHAVIRSDFHWFGPSLPHEIISAVLEFLGMPEEWLHFFRKFLQAPMRFGQDGPDGQSQVRQTGVPMSHALSDVFGEVILFIMDFAVNRATAGSYLYRLHDDFWFWGTQDLCERGWEAMTEFASTMGIRFNKEKTGSVVFAERNMALHIDVSNSSDLDSDGHQPITKVAQLPEGEVRWGFLRLDPAATRFVIDQTMVDEHIAELRLQLSHCTSIFSYVQAYNAYLARFFSNNFGMPSYAFGPQHIDNMIDTFAKIQRAIFPSGNVTEYLAQLARDRFGVEDIPDGVWYWPVRMGGLELCNPMAPLFCMRETLRQTPEQILTEQLEEEESAYESAKVRFGRSNSKELRDARLTAGLSTAAVGEDFMSKEEFMRYREERSVYLGNAYQVLLSIPQEYEISETSNITSWLNALPVSSRNSKPSAGIVRSFGSMQPYWKWVLAVYGAQIVKKYGSLQMVDATQVPLGVVSVMQSGRKHLETSSAVEVVRSTVSIDDCRGITELETRGENMTTQTPKSSPLTSIFNSLSSLSPTPSTIQPPTQTRRPTQTRTSIEELTRILPSDQPPSTTTTSPLHNLSTEDTERARSLFLSLHVLFPHELLPALDLLDRGLVTRMTRLHSPSEDNDDGGAATNSGTADTKMDSDFHHIPSSASPNPNPTARPHTSNAATTSKPECECGCEVEVFYIQSASSTTTTSGRYSHRNRKAPANARAHASTFYEVRLDSWNCSCPAFSVSAFQGMGMGMGLYLDNNNTATAIQSTEAALARPSPFKSDSSALDPVPEADAEADAGHQQWRFGGVATNLQESRPSAPHSLPSCKHILAAVLAKVAPGLFAKHGVIQKAVTHEELVGWGAGWGEFGGG